LLGGEKRPTATKTPKGELFYNRMAQDGRGSRTKSLRGPSKLGWAVERWTVGHKPGWFSRLGARMEGRGRDRGYSTAGGDFSGRENHLTKAPGTGAARRGGGRFVGAPSPQNCLPTSGRGFKVKWFNFMEAASRSPIFSTFVFWGRVVWSGHGPEKRGGQTRRVIGRLGLERGHGDSAVGPLKSTRQRRKEKNSPRHANGAVFGFRGLRLKKGGKRQNQENNCVGHGGNKLG